MDNGSASYSLDVLVKTKTVEAMLAPLIDQVTTLVNHCPSTYRKGQSKKALVMCGAVEKATENFIERGVSIANDFPEMREELLSAVEEVRRSGEMMRNTAFEFANDPCSAPKRSTMTRASRNLLNDVARLLIIADMIDVKRLLQSLRIASNDLDQLKNASSNQEVVSTYDQFGRSLGHLQGQAVRRQRELKDLSQQQQMANARQVLTKNAPILLTSSKTYVRHPELSAAKENRDYVFDQMSGAFITIEGVAAKSAADPNGDDATSFGSLLDIEKFLNLPQGIGELAAALDLLDQLVVIDPPIEYDERRMRPALEQKLEAIISEAALIADGPSTREYRREKIVSECNAVRQALQDLLSQYLINQKMLVQQQGENAALAPAVTNMHLKTRNLRKQLRRAVVDHVSDAFIDCHLPLRLLLDAAHSGDESHLEDGAKLMQEFTKQLLDVGHLVTNISTSEDGVKIVRISMNNIESLSPQVVNAARVLAARPRSKVAQENMGAFERRWNELIALFMDAVDDLINIDDYLAVAETHILEDVNKSVTALQNRDTAAVERVTSSIQGRINRICHVVVAEMDNFEPCQYTERVLEAANILNQQIVPYFVQVVNEDCLLVNKEADVDENGFIDAARQVYDGVVDLRRAVLMIRTQEEIEELSDIEIEGAEDDDELAEQDQQQQQVPQIEYPADFYTTDQDAVHEQLSDQPYARIRQSASSEEDMIGGMRSTDRAMMRELPAEARAMIQQEVEFFQQEWEKARLEVAKWDDSGNEIIVLSKKMCIILMEMTDFTRGRGSFTSTMQVIAAAKEISELGSRLDKLAKSIADNCPDSATKKDLLAYLQRIALYCHQLNITSKVKADVQSVGGELVVSNLESVTSLITAAKNLMNAVVLTVKASYVASTKYTRKAGPNASLILWRMKRPEKKPLVHRENVEEARTRLHKSSQIHNEEPEKTLAQFQ